MKTNRDKGAKAKRRSAVNTLVDGTDGMLVWRMEITRFKVFVWEDVRIDFPFDE